MDLWRLQTQCVHGWLSVKNNCPYAAPLASVNVCLSRFPQVHMTVYNRMSTGMADIIAVIDTNHGCVYVLQWSCCYKTDPVAVGCKTNTHIPKL